MKKVILLLLLMLSSYIRAQKLNSATLQILEPKIGLANYPIDKTTLSEIIAAFGNDYEKNQEFALKKSKELPEFYEVKYKCQGISFYFFDNDSTQTIKAVKFYKPFKGKTATNIILNKSNFGDVLIIDKSSKMLISESGRVGVDEFWLATKGISFSGQISNLGIDDKFPYKDKLNSVIIDEIYISNYQYYLLVN